MILEQDGPIPDRVSAEAGTGAALVRIIQRAAKGVAETKRGVMTHGNSYDSLSEGVKAKLLGCETPEEVLALAQEEGYELTDEQLAGASGGWGGKCENQNYCFDDGRNIGE